MTYNKYTWTDGEYIYPSQLNHIENGIHELDEEYTPYQWASGALLSSVRFNHIEDGVYALHDDYEKTNWQRNDIITAERLNHIEDNIYKISDHTITAVATNGTIPETTGWEIVGDVATKIVAEGEPYGTLPEPTRTGYSFTGWFTASTGGTEVTSETVMGDSDVSIYAQWQVETKTTVLYTDGTFIINEPASQRAANIQAHGAVTNEYDAYDGDTHNYVFTAANQRPWHNERTSITNVLIGANISPTSMAYWFNGFSNVTTVDISKIDEASVTNINYMFQSCGSLKTIYSTGNFSNATGSGVFSSCSSLVGGFGTTYASSRVTSAYAKIDEASEGYGYFTLKNGYMTTLYTDGMFIINEPQTQRSANIAAHGAVVNEWNPFDATLCKYIFTGYNGRPWSSQTSSISATKVGTAIKPTSLAYWYYGFQNCTSFDLSNLNTSDATTMLGMFQNLKTSVSLDLSNFNTANVTTMNQMFRGSNGITNITFGNSFDTSNVTSMQGMFGSCKGLTSLNLKVFDTRNVTDATAMFNECDNLVTIYATSLLDLSGISSSADVFYKCFAIVGGAGTTYSGTTKAYAHIDGGPSNPGYFTAA